jgi:Rieske Fe-S protein
MITFATMKMSKKIKTRRIFLKTGVIGITVFFVFIWNKLTLNFLENNRRKQLVLNINDNKSISFFDEFIVIKSKENLSVFSSHCTHLGCKINKTENGRLVCPCHGSEYDLEGNVIKGPAYKSLEKVEFKLSSDGTRIEIES